MNCRGGLMDDHEVVLVQFVLRTEREGLGGWKSDGVKWFVVVRVYQRVWDVVSTLTRERECEEI